MVEVYKIVIADESFPFVCCLTVGKFHEHIPEGSTRSLKCLFCDTGMHFLACHKPSLENFFKKNPFPEIELRCVLFKRICLFFRSIHVYVYFV